MKQAKYLAATAGLLPAFGLAAGTYAPAYAAPPAAKSTSMATRSGKTVNPSVANVVPCYGVKGYTEVTNSGSDVFITRFWSGILGNPVSYRCIGTVEGSWEYWDRTPDWHFRVRIYSNNKSRPAYSNVVGYSCNGFKCYAAIGVHKYFHVPVKVCTAFIDNFAAPPTPHKTVIQCKSPNVN